MKAPQHATARRLSPRQLEFARAYVRPGATGKSAYEAAYGPTREASSCASRLLHNESVSAEIARLREEAAQEVRYELKHVLGVGLLGGIGFTMSIFIADLGFVNMPDDLLMAKTGILLASLIAGVGGFFWLKFHTRDRVAEP